VRERAVKMRRLPAAGMLSALLERGDATPALVRRIARKIATFHASAASGPGVDEYGTRATIAAHWQENFDQVAPFVDQSIPAWELDAIRRYVDRMLADESGRFDQRVADGRIRDGHGDLHARSICLRGRDLVIFDCIEFSARYRCADVAADVAFLAMDLDHHARPDLGWAFVDEYVRRSGDRELLHLLDFYTCYRAFVRGKVLSFRLREDDLDADERHRIIAEARAYFDLAAVYAGGMPRPTLIVMTGLPASGKSTLAQELAHRLGMVYGSTDIVRKQRAGLAPAARAGARFGTGLYDTRQTLATYAALRRFAARWLERGVSVVLDGTFADPRQRRLARQLAQRAGAHFLVAQTVCDDTTARARILRREEDPARVSDATWEIYQQLRQAFVPPDELAVEELFADTTGGGGSDALIQRLVATRSEATG
jgi:aminoglycoside phosphotransferase family enzyme/predicted kinase